MKKIILGSFALLFFSISLLIIQISCSKSTAQNSNIVNQINKVLTVRYSGGANPVQFWVMNYDGTNQVQIVPALPTGIVPYQNSVNGNAVLSPDGAYLFFRGSTTGGGNIGLYRCDISGANAIQIGNLYSNDVVAGAY